MYGGERIMGGKNYEENVSRPKLPCTDIAFGICLKKVHSSELTLTNTTVYAFIISVLSEQIVSLTGKNSENLFGYFLKIPNNHINYMTYKRAITLSVKLMTGKFIQFHGLKCIMFKQLCYELSLKTGIRNAENGISWLKFRQKIEKKIHFGVILAAKKWDILVCWPLDVRATYSI
ncbi:hypothetical protein BpHYR1_032958 [Brachionus plicatilis]|uniref:Uncharacterized protein n=1 Tax=Brachionus plicatilis TaxID=10195 RepID=A0A3M7QTM9_BRAPC|nr:hypothetical protein BpHYR1_032958 [Brachionus plicatilis]